MIFKKTTHYLGANEVKYKINGTKLTAYRRAQLRRFAKKLDIDLGPDESKNSLVLRIKSKLDAMGAESELSV